VGQFKKLSHYFSPTEWWDNFSNCPTAYCRCRKKTPGDFVNAIFMALKQKLLDAPARDGEHTPFAGEVFKGMLVARFEFDPGSSHQLFHRARNQHFSE
jgi:hypothetical protein